MILGTMNERSMIDIDRLAAVMTTGELTEAGLSRAQIETLMRRGTLISLERGVYASAELAERLRLVPAGEIVLRTAAALATSRPGAVASHQTAARLHGLDLIGRPSPLVAITRPRGAGSRSGKPSVQVHVARLPARHVGRRFDIPVTTVARTVIDLARTMEFRDGVVVADSALRQGLTSKAELRRVLTECQRSRGARNAAQVVEFADRLSESALESIARVAFRECGLPPPALQVEFRGDEFVARVDFYWAKFKTVAEADGAMKYDDRSRAMLQLQRDAKLREIGCELVHFSWQEITRTPDRVAASIRAAFRRGTERGRVSEAS